VIHVREVVWTVLESARPPKELPAGLELPDGRFLYYGPDATCECETCTAAFDAYRNGEAVWPSGDLPW